MTLCPKLNCVSFTVTFNRFRMWKVQITGQTIPQRCYRSICTQHAKRWKRRQTLARLELHAPHRHDLAPSSSIPTENDWLEPDKEEFQHSGQKSETRAEITLHVDVVSELTLIAASCWLQGFTGLAHSKCLRNREDRKHRLWAGACWICQWSQCYSDWSRQKSFHHIWTLVLLKLALRPPDSTAFYRKITRILFLCYLLLFLLTLLKPNMWSIKVVTLPTNPLVHTAMILNHMKIYFMIYIYCKLCKNIHIFFYVCQKVIYWHNN